ncbi:MAG: phosphotransferase family protein, partial [Pseudomonadota bacterium]
LRAQLVQDAGDGLGEGFVMSRIEGETLPGRILRKPDYAEARAGFAEEAGRILAAIHRIDPAGLPLRELSPRAALDDLAARHRRYGQPRPVFELAIRWLADHAPAPVPARLVHGDFRMGNLMFGPEGVRAVLDWELVHLGDPASDLGWLCMESWRFGGEKPVGGLGEREALLAAYVAAGGASVDPAALRWWETLAALRWGVMIEEMHSWVVSGADASVERHVIARRASEIELVLMADLTGRAA